MAKSALRSRWILLLLIPGLAAALVLIWGIGGSAAQGDTLTVTKTADTNDGSCDPDDCSLRGTIARAEDGDSIITPAGTYTLTLDAELGIDKDLTLTGAGPGGTIIQASSVNPVLSPDDPGVADFRVFNITGGTVAISGVTIRHGKTSGDGGGMLNSGTLTLTNSTVSGNRAIRGGGGFTVGGGMGNFGTLTLINSTVSGNAADGLGLRRGGGIWNLGTLTLTNSTVSDNTARFGGGIYNSGGTITLTNSTVSGNTATEAGGGIYNNFGGTLTLANSTVSGNTSGQNGGGILNRLDGTLVLTNSTVSGNTANTEGGGNL